MTASRLPMHACACIRGESLATAPSRRKTADGASVSAGWFLLNPEFYVAGEPVSRILCGTQFAKRTVCRGDHSSSPGIATGIQQPTRGFSFTMACATAKGVRSFAGTLAHRAGPALPSYLALHHAGFSVPPVLPPERWALTPPFHPCQTLRAFRRRLAGFPARCHRAALRRRSILCGTFRSALSGTVF